MKRVAVWIDGEMSMEQVAQIFRDAGWHLHCRNGLMVVDPVPGIVRADPPETNIVPMRRSTAKGSR